MYNKNCSTKSRPAKGVKSEINPPKNPIPKAFKSRPVQIPTDPPDSAEILAELGIWLAEADTDLEACPNCGSLKLDRLPAPRPHHTKLECGDCGRFLRWLPSPKSIAKREKLRQRIEKLLPAAAGWDRDFLKSIARQLYSGKSLSPKQIAQIDRIEQEVAA